ncbi:hypothetical protein Cabys_2388 [Caldithrix abyssi DSM 13497]|uniref:Uncharacterized protein n=1 Tax=Caldithrix abyssi DSM 13497 TaxID=880073 RepID=A0A1J1CA24_CALAY|nr:hypothetical protein Cabys_2388 [Caldithrix abyssi DSM 13497]
MINGCLCSIGVPDWRHEIYLGWYQKALNQWQEYEESSDYWNRANART